MLKEKEPLINCQILNKSYLFNIKILFQSFAYLVLHVTIFNTNLLAVEMPLSNVREIT